MKIIITLLLIIFHLPIFSQINYDETYIIELCDKIYNCLKQNKSKEGNLDFCVTQYENEINVIEKLPIEFQEKFILYMANTCKVKLDSFTVFQETKELEKSSVEKQKPIMKCASISAIKMNVLYEIINNPIEYWMSNEISDSINYKSTQGELIKTDKASLIISDLTPGVVEIEINNNKDFRYREYYRVKKLPAATFKLNEIKTNSINKSELSKISEIKGYLDNFDFPVGIKINSFQVILINKNGNIYEMKNEGNEILKETIEKIKMMSFGDILVIKDINYSYIDKYHIQDKIIKNESGSNIAYYIIQ